MGSVKMIGKDSIVGEGTLEKLLSERMFSPFWDHVAELMGRYYILRDEMLGDLTRLAGEQVRSNAPWQVSFVVTLFLYFALNEVPYFLTRSLLLKRAGLKKENLRADDQDIEATLHCIRYSSEAVPLGEEVNLPILFGNDVLGTLAQRPISGRGEERLRLTVVCLIRMSSLQPVFIGLVACPDFTWRYR